MAENIPVVLLSGATATGKTGVALALARQLADSLPVEIISMDSAMVYRGMDIGTAKPTGEERAVAPHHLIDIRDPADAYSAAAFRDDALSLVAEVRARGHLPLVVGGTLLYARALDDGLSELPEADPEIRAAIEHDAATQGWDALHARLAEIDPVIAGRIHPNDAQRIQRALEIHACTGEPPSRLQGSRAGGIPGSVLRFALQLEDRTLLHQRIEQRFAEMMQAGFLDEVRTLRERVDLHADLPAMRCVGYRQLWQHLDGDYDLDEAVYRGIVATRQLAKRQMTWLRGSGRGEAEWVWLDALEPDQAVAAIRRALGDIPALTE